MRRRHVLRHGILPFLALAACVPLEERDPLPDWVGEQEVGTAPGVTDVTDITDVDPTAFALLAPPRGEIGWDVVVHDDTDDWASACEVFPDGTLEGYVTQDCLLEIHELDLWAGGLHFDFVVPEGVCDWVAWGHYQYEAWEVGVGPTEVLIEFDEDGDIVGGEHHVEGTPVCEYDHGSQVPDAPNCCLGTYTVTTYETGEDPAADGTTSPTQFWGGDASNCYGGAAFIDPEASFTEDGWPRDTIVLVDQERFEKRFEFPNLSANFRTNVPLANHYEPDDHDGTSPASLRGFAARPYYEFTCYDHAMEVFAHLRLQVREWNEMAEFALGPDGDPATVGVEPVSGHPIDDIAAWGVATPGDELFIEDAQ